MSFKFAYGNNNLCHKDHKKLHNYTLLLIPEVFKVLLSHERFKHVVRLVFMQFYTKIEKKTIEISFNQIDPD